MKRLELTDAELHAVRLAVAQLAGSAPEGVDLRTALTKLDRAAAGSRLTAGPRRKVEILTLEPVGSRVLERVLFDGVFERWTSRHVAIVTGAKWKTSTAGRVVVRIDGNEVDPATLGENEVLS